MSDDILKDSLVINTGHDELDNAITIIINKFVDISDNSKLSVSEAVDNGNINPDHGDIGFGYRLEGELFNKPYEVDLSFYIKPKNSKFKYMGSIISKDKERKNDIFRALIALETEIQQEDVDLDAIDKAVSLSVFRFRKDKEGEWKQALLGKTIMPILKGTTT